MKSEIVLSNPNIKAEGRITIEYTDGITGEVKNRFQSENHAFPGGFMRLNNFAFASDTGTYPFCIMLSDRGDNINYDIPFIPGSIIGYGSPNSAASGEMQGSENTAARSLGVYSNGKWHYKRQWSWLPSQVKSEIKSFGILPLHVGTSGSDERSKWHICSYQLNAAGPGSSAYNCAITLNDWDIGYSISGFVYLQGKSNGAGGSLYKYRLSQPPSQTRETIDLKNIIPVPDDIPNSSAYYESYGSGMVAIDVDTGDLMIIILYKDTSSIASVQITRLDPEATVVKSNQVYKCGTYTKVSSQYPFTGYSASLSSHTGYYSKGKIYTLYADKDTRKGMFTEINPSAWSDTGDFMDAFTFHDDYTYLTNRGYYPAVDSVVYVSVSNGYPIMQATRGVPQNSTSTTSEGIMIVIDPKTNRPYACRTVGTTAGSNYQGGKPFMANFNGNNVVIQHVSYSYGTSTNGTFLDGDYSYYRNLSDYTLYVLPDNAPKREEGQGVTVTYEIAWGYE